MGNITIKGFPDGWETNQGTLGYSATKRLHGDLREVFAQDEETLITRAKDSEARAYPLATIDRQAEAKRFSAQREYEWAIQRGNKKAKAPDQEYVTETHEGGISLATADKIEEAIILDLPQGDAKYELEKRIANEEIRGDDKTEILIRHENEEVQRDADYEHEQKADDSPLIVPNTAEIQKQEAEARNLVETAHYPDKPLDVKIGDPIVQKPGKYPPKDTTALKQTDPMQPDKGAPLKSPAKDTKNKAPETLEAQAAGEAESKLATDANVDASMTPDKPKAKKKPAKKTPAAKKYPKPPVVDKAETPLLSGAKPSTWPTHETTSSSASTFSTDK